jgi:ADP-glucose pyrophosphorylase
LYDGYWEDIGTIEAFYNANLGITKKPVPDFRYAFMFHSVGAEDYEASHVKALNANHSHLF